MAAFNFDPKEMIGGLIANVIQSSIIVGMPSATAKVPNFVFCEIIDESIRTSVSLPSLQIASGDLSSKAVVDSGEYKIKIVLSDDANFPAGWMNIVSLALSNITDVANQLIDSGGVLPNFSATTTNYVMSQIGVLTAMKNNMQPITILQAYVNLGSIGQNSPFLSSSWYISNIAGVAEEADQGLALDVTLKELLSPRAGQFGLGSIMGQIKALSGELISPLAGGAMGAFIG